ncbi:helix-turn-helix domain-containing protein [Schlesneria paludicola]|uniref:helix-turn-helix domain-containing protein n=1 Tax=Schlesneria paludicola TaxID=360056 RepID=UPI00029B0D2B|nr:helix-turn-helix transcriptional regulator [Schlesneria paludicola]
MTKATGKPRKFVLTAEQREIAEQMREIAEKEKPEILAEGRRVKAASQALSAHLRGVMVLLKAVRKSQGLTLDEMALRTGIQKASLSRLENSDDESNVTINTLYRIAEALDYEIQVSVVPRPAPVKPVKRKPSISELVGKVR